QSVCVHTGLAPPSSVRQGRPMIARALQREFAFWGTPWHHRPALRSGLPRGVPMPGRRPQGDTAMPGGSLDVARAALDSATGQPCRLFWSPVTLQVLSPGRVTSSPFGTVPRRMPSALPSWLWRPAVFTAVVSALAETLLRDLADPD